MNIIERHTVAEAERSIDKWRDGRCPTCQTPSRRRFCSDECRQVWWQTYMAWLRDEGRCEPNLVSA